MSTCFRGRLSLVRCIFLGLVFWTALALMGVIAWFLVPLVMRDIAEFERPTAPSAFVTAYAYASTILHRCEGLGYTYLDRDTGLYIGQADCRQAFTSEELHRALEQVLAAQRAFALWFEQGATFFLIAWPASAVRCQEPSEHAFIIHGTRLIILRGALVCKDGQIRARETSYAKKLKKYLASVPEVSTAAPCYQ